MRLGREWHQRENRDSRVRIEHSGEQSKPGEKTASIDPEACFVCPSIARGLLRVSVTVEFLQGLNSGSFALNITSTHSGIFRCLYSYAAFTLATILFLLFCLSLFYYVLIFL